MAKAQASACAIRLRRPSSHADRDPDDTLPAEDLSRIEGLNDLEMVSNALNLYALGHILPTVYGGLVPLLGLLHPGILDWEAMEHDQPGLAAARRQIANPSDRTTSMMALRHLLRQAGELPT